MSTQPTTTPVLTDRNKADLLNLRARMTSVGKGTAKLPDAAKHTAAAYAKLAAACAEVIKAIGADLGEK